MIKAVTEALKDKHLNSLSEKCLCKDVITKIFLTRFISARMAICPLCNYYNSIFTFLNKKQVEISIGIKQKVEGHYLHYKQNPIPEYQHFL